MSLWGISGHKRGQLVSGSSLRLSNSAFNTQKLCFDLCCRCLLMGDVSSDEQLIYSQWLMHQRWLGCSCSVSKHHSLSTGGPAGWSIHSPPWCPAWTLFTGLFLMMNILIQKPARKLERKSQGFFIFHLRDPQIGWQIFKYARCEGHSES